MAIQIRTEQQRNSDLVRISKLYLQGHTQLEIAQQIGVSRTQISYDIKQLFLEWKRVDLEEIIKKNRLVVTVNENINELKEVVVTSEDIEKFLDLKEDEFKGFDYERDKSSRINNMAH